MAAVGRLGVIGKYTVESIFLRDLLVVQTLVLIFAFAYARLDPRIRYA